MSLKCCLLTHLENAKMFQDHLLCHFLKVVLSRGWDDAKLLLLLQLHWLPAKQRLLYKMAHLTRKLFTISTPAFLDDLLHTQTPTWTWTIILSPNAHCTMTSADIARHAFSVAAPSTWNSLPADVRLCQSVTTFKWHFIFSHTILFHALLSTLLHISDLNGAIEIFHRHR